MFFLFLLLEGIIILYAGRPYRRIELYFKEESWMSGIIYLGRKKKINLKNSKNVKVVCDGY